MSGPSDRALGPLEPFLDLAHRDEAVRAHVQRARIVGRHLQVALSAIATPRKPAHLRRVRVAEVLVDLRDEQRETGSPRADAAGLFRTHGWPDRACPG